MAQLKGNSRAGSATILTADNYVRTLTEYGTYGNGVDDDAPALWRAIRAIAGEPSRLFVPAGTYRIAASLSIPVNVELDLGPGATFRVDQGYTLTVLGKMRASGAYSSGKGVVSCPNGQFVTAAAYEDGTRGDEVYFKLLDTPYGSKPNLLAESSDVYDRLGDAWLAYGYGRFVQVKHPATAKTVWALCIPAYAADSVGAGIYGAFAVPGLQLLAGTAYTFSLEAWSDSGTNKVVLTLARSDSAQVIKELRVERDWATHIWSNPLTDVDPLQTYTIRVHAERNPSAVYLTAPQLEIGTTRSAFCRCGAYRTVRDLYVRYRNPVTHDVEEHKLLRSDDAQANLGQHSILLAGDTKGASIAKHVTDLDMYNVRSVISDPSNTGSQSSRFTRALVAAQTSRASGNMSLVAASESSSALGDRSAVLASSQSEAVGLTSGSVSGNHTLVVASQRCRTEANYSAVLASFGVANPVNGTVAGGWGTTAVPAKANRTWDINSLTGAIRSAAGVTTGALADYGEYVENLKKGIIPPGTPIVIDAGKARAAAADEPIDGIVSCTAGILLNDSLYAWQGRYLTDDWGRVQYEDIPDPTWEPYVAGPDGTRIANPNPRGTVRAPKVNPEYDPTRENVPRSERPEEWTLVGMLGQIRVRLDPKAKAKVGDWLKAGDGVCVPSTDPTRIRVMRLIRKDIALCWVR